MSVCMSAVSAGTSIVLIKYTGKYVKIYLNIKITFVTIRFREQSCLWHLVGES